MAVLGEVQDETPHHRGKTTSLGEQGTSVCGIFNWSPPGFSQTEVNACPSASWKQTGVNDSSRPQILVNSVLPGVGEGTGGVPGV